MMEPVIAEGFDITINRAEVLRFLGATGRTDRRPPDRIDRVLYRPSDRIDRAPLERMGRQPAGRIERVLEESMQTAADLLGPRGLYTITAGGALPDSTIFEALERVAFCVCTIGPALEDEVSRRSGDDDILGAVVLDAVGSVAAEGVADYMDGMIQEEAAREGLRTSCRASPGYGDWDIREQASIFRLLPAERIGVRLTEGMMMIPRKSVSFAVHISESPARMRSEDSCRNCGRTDCPFRLLE